MHKSQDVSPDSLQGQQSSKAKGAKRHFTPNLQPGGKHSPQAVVFDGAAGENMRHGRSMLLECAINHEGAWKDFLQANCNSMFQTALLLSADAGAAEAALVDGIDDLDLSRPPEKQSSAIWERAVIQRSIGARQSASPAEASTVRSMLHPGLRTVIGIERCPRICFVLHMLLGYQAAFCAQMLGSAESETGILLRKAVTQLCGTGTPA